MYLSTFISPASLFHVRVYPAKRRGKVHTIYFYVTQADSGPYDLPGYVNRHNSLFPERKWFIETVAKSASKFAALQRAFHKDLYFFAAI